MEDRKYLTPGDVKLLHDSYEYIRLELIDQKKEINKNWDKQTDRWQEHDEVSRQRHERVLNCVSEIKEIIIKKPCELHSERTMNNKAAIDRLTAYLWAILVLLIGLAIKSFI